MHYLQIFISGFSAYNASQVSLSISKLNYMITIIGYSGYSIVVLEMLREGC